MNNAVAVRLCFPVRSFRLCDVALPKRKSNDQRAMTIVLSQHKTYRQSTQGYFETCLVNRTTMVRTHKQMRTSTTTCTTAAAIDGHQCLNLLPKSTARRCRRCYCLTRVPFCLTTTTAMPSIITMVAQALCHRWLRCPRPHPPKLTKVPLTMQPVQQLTSRPCFTTSTLRFVFNSKPIEAGRR